jgi:DNA-binding CsgD family transcriptional regulator
METRKWSLIRSIPKAPPVAEPAQSGILLVDETLAPIALDAGAAMILKAQNRERTNNVDAPLTLPDEVLTAIRDRSPGDSSSTTSFFLVGDRRYRCRSYVVQDQDQSPVGADDATPLPARFPVTVLHLEIEQRYADPITQVATEYHLTEREQEALGGIAIGLTVKELAERMNISPNTVKVFVRLIMLKLGVTTRAAIIAKLLDYNEASARARRA